MPAKSTQIWVEIIPGQDEPFQPHGVVAWLPPGKGWHAQFAASIQIRPFKELERLKWGFNFGSLLEEVIDRQRLFIESQHFPGEPVQEPEEGRTLALRCLNDPEAAQLRLSLLVKVHASTRQRAHAFALQTWQEIQSIFPYEYTLVPALDQIQFQRLTGWEWLQEIREQFTLVEIERFEGRLSTGSERLYLLGTWKNSLVANEQTWRVLAGASQRILMTVILRPTVLYDYDVAALQAIAEFAEKIRQGPVNPALLPYLNNATAVYRKMAETLRHPFLARVVLASPDGIPEYIPRDIGYAMTHLDKPEPSTPGFQICVPKSEEEITDWKRLLFWIEPEALPRNGIDERFQRLRSLVNVSEAISLFRLPFPPEGGIPGITFG